MEDLNSRIFFRSSEDIAVAMLIIETLVRLNFMDPDDSLMLDINLARRTWIGKM